MGNPSEGKVRPKDKKCKKCDEILIGNERSQDVCTPCHVAEERKDKMTRQIFRRMLKDAMVPILIVGGIYMAWNRPYSFVIVGGTLLICILISLIGTWYSSAKRRVEEAPKPYSEKNHYG